MDEHKVVMVIPALNEEKTIASVIANIKKYVDVVIVVDDGCTDKTVCYAQQQGGVVLSHDENHGYDKSIDDGFNLGAQMGATILITFDADGQHHPEDIPMILEPIRAGLADVVVGKRPCHARIAENLFALVGKLKANIDDPLCGLKAYSIKVYNDVGHFDTMKSIGTQLMFEASKRGYRITQRDITLNSRHDEPRFGTRLIANWKIFKAILKILVAG
ncbi:MAG: glycosyltransferase family 2 protein [Phycisphaerae bacterium]|nr:glycosyltransferase family 2 protein [Phycisphaerae bacterium]